MGISRKLSDEKASKVKKLVELGFSNTAIGRALNISEAVVRSYRRGKNVQKNKSIKNVGAGERDRKQTGNTGNDATRDQDPGGKPGDQNTIDNSPGESTTNKTGEGITFIGGKKSMDKKEGSGAKEKDEYQCYNCDHIQGTPFTECPKCGASNDFGE